MYYDLTSVYPYLLGCSCMDRNLHWQRAVSLWLHGSCSNIQLST